MEEIKRIFILTYEKTMLNNNLCKNIKLSF